MNNLICQLEQYIGENLSIRVFAQPWGKNSGLPQYLCERYRFYKMDIIGIECLLMADSDEEEQSPFVIGKHINQIRARSNANIVYVRRSITSYKRTRLIEHKIPFIVPGNQMYLPFLGIELREQMKQRWERKTLFSPSTQTLILYVLWRKETGTVTPAEIARRLGYSAMTMTRAFNELEAIGIGEHSVEGKERHLHFPETGKPLWGKVLPYLNTPVRKRFYLASARQIENDIQAGLSALAYYTMLAEPKIPIFAIPAKEWRGRSRQDELLDLKWSEHEGCEIELWKYVPAQFADQGKVDRLSLYLSLKDSTDERIQSALDVLLRGMEW